MIETTHLITTCQAQKWNLKTHEYEPYQLPVGSVLFANLDADVCCAGCGKIMKFGNGFTSKKIHNNHGLGFTVCEDCHNEEYEEYKKEKGLK